MRKTLLVAAALAVLAAVPQAMAQAYPNRPVRLVVPFTPGGGGDVVARAFQDRMAAALGQPLVIENRGGASAMIGTELVARARPDGYTILLVNSTYVTNPFLQENISYRTPEDFTPIARVVSYPFMLGIRSSLPFRSVPDLVAYAKANPGKLTSGTSGSGSGQHLAGALLKSMAGIDILDVPYSGAGPVMNAIAGGHIDMAFGGHALFEPHTVGPNPTMRMIGTTGLKPSGSPPLKPIAEQGLPGYEFVLWWGLFGPAGLPREIVQKLNAATREAFAHDDVQQRLKSLEGDVEVTGAEELGTFADAELKKWGVLLANQKGK